jgi:hypothetical protein
MHLSQDFFRVAKVALCFFRQYDMWRVFTLATLICKYGLVAQSQRLTMIKDLAADAATEHAFLLDSVHTSEYAAG